MLPIGAKCWVSPKGGFARNPTCAHGARIPRRTILIDRGDFWMAFILLNGEAIEPSGSNYSTPSKSIAST